MNKKITVKDLENLSPDNLRNNFYYLCQESTPKDIEDCFENKKINHQLTGYVISYGLMGAARSDKIQNAKKLLECVKKNENISTVMYNPAINLALKKNHFDFADQLILLTNCFEVDIQCLLSAELDISTHTKKNASVAVLLDYSGSMKQSSIVDDKYDKFSGNSFEMFDKDLDKLELLLNHKVSLNHIKNIVQKACENDNMIPLMSIIKSNYLETLLKDKEFNTFMKNDSFKNIKLEFKHLIDNALLEKKLKIKLPEKNTKTSTKKI